MQTPDLALDEVVNMLSRPSPLTLRLRLSPQLAKANPSNELWTSQRDTSATFLGRPTL